MIEANMTARDIVCCDEMYAIFVRQHGENDWAGKRV
jgi:hypothetical protein